MKHYWNWQNGIKTLKIYAEYTERAPFIYLETNGNTTSMTYM
jgi:hypothetical protein